MDLETKKFYDQYWPRHVPIFAETRKYMLDTISERDLDHALDPGLIFGYRYTYGFQGRDLDSPEQ